MCREDPTAFLQLFFQFGLFDIHIAEFAGIEDVAALDAFNKFGVFIARDDLHAGVLTLGGRCLLGGRFRLDGRHKADNQSDPSEPDDSSSIGLILARTFALSSLKS
jgi:hypothetical protein